MTELEFIRDRVTKLFTENRNAVLLPEDEYSRFSYPKIVKLMNFDVQRYKVEGFGQLMTMLTTTPFGMTLLTCSFMPFEGVSVPYLLMDIMTMKKKQTIFVEYYDCTARKSEQPVLKYVHDKYSALPEYPEKEAWYVSERTEYSLIKSTEPGSHMLAKVALDSTKAYRKAVTSAGKDTANLPSLLNFRERMIKEGNPSSAVLKKVFGEKGAETFFTTCVMPE